MTQIEHGASRRRVGLKPEGRAPVRGGAPLFYQETDRTSVGAVTSGGFGVSLGVPVAMGYVPIARARPGARLFAELRGKRLPIDVCELPFVTLNYRRT